MSSVRDYDARTPQGYEIRRSFMVDSHGYWDHDRSVVRRVR